MPFKLVAAVTLAALLAGCAGKEPLLAPPPPAPRVVEPPKPSPPGAESFFRSEASRSLLVVQASELAMRRSANGQVLRIANRLKSDHTGVAAQLSMAGRRLDLLPSASLLMSDQALLDNLARAPDFDAAYLRTMKRVVENCSQSHGSFAEQGSSPTLRPVARFAASVCDGEMREFF